MKYDVDYIISYILEYDVGIPKVIIFGYIVCTCVLVVVLSSIKANTSQFVRIVSLSFLLFYVAFVFCLTVLFRDAFTTIRIRLHPFWSYGILDNRLIAEIILNVLLFIPIGFLACGCLRKKSIIKIVGIGCSLSLTIEIIQIAARRGVFNIDDVIHNTLGCVFGYGLFKLSNSILKIC